MSLLAGPSSDRAAETAGAGSASTTKNRGRRKGGKTAVEEFTDKYLPFFSPKEHRDAIPLPVSPLSVDEKDGKCRLILELR